jgi:hypothetical protein
MGRTLGRHSVRSRSGKGQTGTSGNGAQAQGEGDEGALAADTVDAIKDARHYIKGVKNQPANIQDKLQMVREEVNYIKQTKMNISRWDLIVADAWIVSTHMHTHTHTHTHSLTQTGVEAL